MIHEHEIDSEQVASGPEAFHELISRASIVVTVGNKVRADIPLCVIGHMLNAIVPLESEPMDIELQRVPDGPFPVVTIMASLRIERLPE